jgi:hypothetical protein
MKTIAKKLTIITTVTTATILSLSITNANLAQAASLLEFRLKGSQR